MKERKSQGTNKPSNRQNSKLTTGNIYKSIWMLALPMMVGNVLQTAFNVVDMIFVGKLGPDSIAAVAICGMIIMLIITLLIGIGIGTTAIIARHIGAKEYVKANEVALQSILLGTFIALLLTVVGYFFSETLLKLFGAEPSVVQLGTVYLRITFLGSITLFILFGGAAILRGAGDARTPMFILILSAVINIIADPLLIFGIGPFPRLEIAGAAIATVFARSVGMFITIYVLIKGYSVIQISFRNIKLKFDTMWRIIKLAVPGSLQMGIRSVSGVILMRIVAQYGTYALAALGIGLRVNMIVMMPGFGLGAATATLVGQNLGAKQPRRAEKSAWISLGIYEGIMICMGFLFYLFAPKIIAVFNTDPNVLRDGISFLHIVTLSYVFLAIAIVMHQALNGAGDTVSPMVITGIAVLGVRIPLAFLLPRLFDLGTSGIWLAVALSTVLEGSVVGFWFRSGRWKKKKV